MTDSRFPSDPPDRPGWWRCGRSMKTMGVSKVGYNPRRYPPRLCAFVLIAMGEETKPRWQWVTIAELDALGWQFGGRVEMPEESE